MALTVHFESDGAQVAMLLDMVEVAKSHSGLNLAVAFAAVLDDFGISEKVSFGINQLGKHLPGTQMLSITCDNASNNDTMVDQLGQLVSNFPGATNRTRCFAHIINLIAKTIIRQFDVPKTKEGQFVDAAMAELHALAKDMDVEDLLTQARHSYRDGDGEEEDDDNEEGWVDERSGLSASDLRELEDDVQPIRKTLVKVRCQRVCHNLPVVADLMSRQQPTFSSAKSHMR